MLYEHRYVFLHVHIYIHVLYIHIHKLQCAITMQTNLLIIVFQSNEVQYLPTHCNSILERKQILRPNKAQYLNMKLIFYNLQSLPP